MRVYRPAALATDPAPIRIARGAWAGSDRELDLFDRCLLLIESSAADTLVVGTTAAQLWELWLPPGIDQIHLATAAPDRLGRHMTRTRRPEVIPHRRQLPDCDRTTLRGLPILSIARTWRDIAATLDIAAVVAAGDSALRLGVSMSELTEVVMRTPRHAGALRARTALPLLDKRSRSRPESHLRVAISRPDLPTFEVNESVYRGEGGWLAEPDLSLAEARIALEYQGSDHAEVHRMRRDLTRFTDLRSEHWLVLPYGPAEVFGRPAGIAAEVRAAVQERAPHLLRSRRSGRVVSCPPSGHE